MTGTKFGSEKTLPDLLVGSRPAMLSPADRYKEKRYTKLELQELLRHIGNPGFHSPDKPIKKDEFAWRDWSSAERASPDR